MERWGIPLSIKLTNSKYVYHFGAFDEASELKE